MVSRAVVCKMIDADGMIGGMFDDNVVMSCFPLVFLLPAGEIISVSAGLNIPLVVIISTQVVQGEIRMKNISFLFIVLCMFVASVTVVTGESFAASKSGSQTVAVTDKVNINTADEAGLATLPGVGEKTAAAIISYRKENGKFMSIDDLAGVKGIGDKKLARIRPYLQEI